MTERLKQYAEAAHRATNAAREKSAKQRREEEAARAELRLTTLSRITKGELEMQQRLWRERYTG